MSIFQDDVKWAEAILSGNDTALGEFSKRYEALLLEVKEKTEEALRIDSPVPVKAFIERVARSIARRYLGILSCNRRAGVNITNLLERLHLNDLWLVCSMEAGCEEAWHRFHARFRKDLQDTAQSFDRNRSSSAEVLEDLDGDLFAAGKDGRGLLTTYDGTGPLGGWLRTVVYRRVLAVRKRKSREPKSLPRADSLDGVVPCRKGSRNGEEPVPEDFAQKMKRALREVFSALPDRDRTLLLLRYKAGVMQKSLARMRGWSEVRLSRHLHDLRQGIWEAVRLKAGFTREEFKKCIPAFLESSRPLAEECLQKI